MNDLFFCIIVLLTEKMFKKFKVCDCFMEIACYCLNISATFTHFRKMCLIHFDNRAKVMMYFY